MLLWIGRGASALAGLATALLGLVVLYGTWQAWDPLPPDGPGIGDPDRAYEAGLGFIGLLLLAGGGWIVARAARRMLRRG